MPLRLQIFAKISPGVATPWPAAPPMATAKVCFMAPSLVGSLFASSPLQSCTSFGRDSKEESDPRGKYTAWESPLARLGSREYTPNYRYILLLNGRGGRGQRRHHSFCCTYLSSNRPPGSKRNIMARPEEFSFQNSQDISVPRVFKGLRKVIRGDRKSTRLNSSHLGISYAVFCLKKKKSIYIMPLNT